MAIKGVAWYADGFQVGKLACGWHANHDEWHVTLEKEK